LKQWKQSLLALKDNIANIKLILSFLCFIEEFRDLSLIEWNFRKLIEVNYSSAAAKKLIGNRGVLLSGQHWEMPAPKCFRAQATVKYKINFISQVMDDSGNLLVSHHDKANLVWLSFKERLGTTKLVEKWLLVRWCPRALVPPNFAPRSLVLVRAINQD
jgi:hypothetical protein